MSVAAARARSARANAGRRDVQVAGKDLDRWVHRTRARFEAGPGPFEGDELEATDEPDRAGLRRERRGGTDEERALLLGEHDRRRARHDDVDVPPCQVGVAGCDRRSGYSSDLLPGDDEIGPSEPVESIVDVGEGRRDLLGLDTEILNGAIEAIGDEVPDVVATSRVDAGRRSVGLSGRRRRTPTTATAASATARRPNPTNAAWRVGAVAPREQRVPVRSRPFVASLQ